MLLLQLVARTRHNDLTSIFAKLLLQTSADVIVHTFSSRSVTIHTNTIILLNLSMYTSPALLL